MADVGIVMPVYRQNLDHLRIALRSVLGQSYRNYRFVIVGDGAPEDVVRTLYEETAGDARVQIVLKPVNEGVAAALNLGFDMLMSDPAIEYLTWVSSDNHYYPYFLEVLYSEMQRVPANVGLVYSSFRQILEDGSPAHDESFLEALHAWQSGPKEKLLDGCIIGPAFLHRTSICRIVGYYRLDPIQDYDYWIRMSEYCDIHFLPVELMDYRLNSPFSLTTSIRNSRVSHRKCWDAAHVAQFDARLRRGIKPDITVIFPVRKWDAETEKNLDRIVDQHFTNIKVYVVDLSSKGIAKHIANSICDPRIRVRRISASDTASAGLSAVRFSKTPFTLLVKNGNNLGSHHFLQHLVLKMAGSQGNVSARFRKRRVTTRDHFGGEVIFGELYRTERLVSYLKKHEGSRKKLSKNRLVVSFH